MSEQYKSICGTKSSCSSQANHYIIPRSVRRIAYTDLHLNKEEILGKGVYGKCIRGKFASVNVCIKVIRGGANYQSTFEVETTLLSQCCHPNLPWLYGAVFRLKAIVLSLHIVNDKSVTIHSTFCSSCTDSVPVFTTDNWKKILYGVISATNYLHSRSILHNDIKCNNIVIERTASEVNSVLIDLGKGCFVKHAKAYRLHSNASKREHIKSYPHIAPDLISGHCKQSKESDLYSLGRVIKQVNLHHLGVPALESLSSQCTEYYCRNRPPIAEIKTFVYNLFY